MWYQESICPLRVNQRHGNIGPGETLVPIEVSSQDSPEPQARLPDSRFETISTWDLSWVPTNERLPCGENCKNSVLTIKKAEESEQNPVVLNLLQSSIIIVRARLLMSVSLSITL